MQNLCEEGSVGPVLCPAGFHCPDVTRKVECPEGHTLTLTHPDPHPNPHPDPNPNPNPHPYPSEP